MFDIIIFIATSFAVGLSGALVPGPMMTVTISDSLKKGFIAGPLVVLGHFIAEFTLIILIFTGLRWFISSSTAVFIIGTLGGLMMVLMGSKIMCSSTSLSEIRDDNEIYKNYGSILNGIITSFSNPFFFIWWATIGWAFMFKGLELAGIIGIFGFLIGHWAADLSWFSIVSFFTSRGTQVMTEKHYKLLMNASGVFLIILGVYFMLNAQRIV